MDNMARIHNGRFNVPGRGENSVLWLIGGLVLFCLRPVGTLLSIALSVPCFVMFGKKNKQKRMMDRYRLYCSVIGQRGRVSVSEFLEADRRGIEQIRADLKRLISRGYFGPEAYFDRAQDCIVIAANKKQREKNWADVAADFLESLRKNFGVQPEAETPKSEKAEPVAAKENVRNYADELEQTLNELYRLNGTIRDEKVSTRIDRIGVLTADIFHAVMQHPEREADVRKFMNYYLPTTLKLLKSYDMLEDQSYQSQSIIESRKKIENVLDTLIAAFEKQLENLFKSDALDIATDIEVLETMMAGDGLSGDLNMPGH